VIESESSTGLHVDDTETGESKMLPSSGSQSRAYYARLTCPGISECVPMNECPELLQEALRKCSRGDKSLFCGNEPAGDPFLCCPRNPMDIRNGCGRTLIQGQNYKGLGAFPFVARVGFKSECVIGNEFMFVYRPPDIREVQSDYSSVSQSLCTFLVNDVLK
jgi:hypothetical protein